jgi:hypothetical protein
MADSGCLNTASNTSIDYLPSLKDATKAGELFAVLAGCNKSSLHGGGYGAGAGSPAPVVACLRAKNSTALLAAAAEVHTRRMSLGLASPDGIFHPGKLLHTYEYTYQYEYARAYSTRCAGQYCV